MDKATFNKFRELIYAQSGISLREGKESLVAARIGHRMRALNIDTPRQYLDYLATAAPEEEMISLLDAISTNVTSFFREPQHFDIMKKALAEWGKEGQREFRAWSAACSSGEEPYTIAMTALESMPAMAEMRILATDISTRVLKFAKTGEYDAQRVASIPPMLRERHFKRLDGPKGPSFKASDKLRSMVTFSRINLSTPPFPMKGPFDFVFCRNVMIYFDSVVRNRLVEEMFRVLKVGGYLFVGHSETLTDLKVALKSVKPSVYLKIGE